MDDKDLMLCEYGCGQEAKHQFKNGKWCCSNNHSLCNNIRKKISQSGIIAQNKPEVKIKISGENSSSKRSEVRKKMSERKKGENNSAKDKNVRAKLTEIQKELWQDQITRKRRIEGISRAWQNLERREKQSETIRKISMLPEVKEKKSKAQIEVSSRPEVKDFRRNRMVNGGALHALSFIPREVYEKQSERMLNGGAVYMNQFIKNPSKPQVELFKMLQQLCPDPIMNYPIYYRKKWNYSIDVADSRLGLAFEYDEPYWHKHKGKDLRRQKRIEELGWKFLRYEKLPALEQLKNDINRVMEPIYECKNKKEKSLY